MNKVIAIGLVAGVLVAFLGYTGPGRHVLNSLGFASACNGQGC
jgi:hypothetical protein